MLAIVQVLDGTESGRALDQDFVRTRLGRLVNLAKKIGIAAPTTYVASAMTGLLA